MSTGSIEETIRQNLAGETRQNALDFVAYLRGSEIPFTVNGTYVDAHLRGRNVCSILITGEDDAPGPWTIWSDQEPGSWVFWSNDEHAPDHTAPFVDERTKELAWAHVNPCASCGGECSPGKRKEVLGKTFDGLCSSALAFTNPDTAALDCAKRMVDARKRDILQQQDASLP